MNDKKYQIMLSAGESSGDQRGAEILQDLKVEFEAFGMGGERLKKAGMEIIVDNKKMAVVGLVEVIKHYSFLKRQLKKMQDMLVKKKPNLLVLIDYPDFNLRLAKTAKQYNIKVLYYISPQIWAWRQNRVKKIKKLVDHMAVIFPFEVDFYQKYQVPVTFVGHPLFAKINNFKTSAKQIIKRDKNTKIITLLPGSRKNEIIKHLPIMLASIKRLQEHNKNIKAIIAVANTIKKDYFSHLPSDVITTKKTYDAILQSDLVLCASGTATLETGLLQKPLVVIYKLNQLSYFFIKNLLKVPFVGLINIVSGKKIISEFVQQEATLENICNEANKILNDINYRKKMLENLNQTYLKMKNYNNQTTIAELVKKTLQT
jgi:lipid-A-disaccharide synthase